MEYKGYHARIEYDADDEIFVGSVIGINDSINFHGKSVEELSNMFAQSIDNYLDMCTRYGKRPDKEYRGSLNIRLTPALHRMASIQSAEDHISLNQFIVNAVQEKCSKKRISNSGAQ